MDYRSSQRRTLLVTGGMTLLFTGLAGRLISLHDPAADRSRNNVDGEGARRQRPILASRGDIVDRKGETLATYRPIFSVVLEPEALPPHRAQLRRMIRALSESVEASIPVAVSGPVAREVSRFWNRRLGQEERMRKEREEEERRLDEEKRLKDAYLEILAGLLAEKFNIDSGKLLSQLDPVIAINPSGRKYWRYRRGYAVSDASVEDIREVESKLNSLEEAEILRRVWGVEFEERGERIYLAPHTACHVLGRVRYDDRVYHGQESPQSGDPPWLAPPDEGWQVGLKNRQLIGVEGVEATMDSVLRGEHGLESLGLMQEWHALQKPQTGKTVQLTIDSELQSLLEKHVAAAWEYYRPHSIAAVMMDPATGEILALANRPWFNLVTGEVEGSGDAGLRNQVVSSLYEPGSTFKMISYSGAIDSGAATWDETISFGGTHTDSGWQPSWAIKDVMRPSSGTVEAAFYRSSNVAAYKLVKRMGAGPFYNFIRSFGIDEKPESGLGGEVKGQVPDPRDPERWSGSLTTSRVAFGYNVMVTPLHLAMVVSTLCNRGRLMQPRIVAGLLDSDRRMVEPNPPRVLRDVIKPETAAGLLAAMEKVVHDKSGTGKLAAVPGYRAAGKTGTAKNYARPAVNGERSYIVSFAGCIPAGAPRLAIVVAIDGPTELHGKSCYGGTIAAPVFSAIAAEAMTCLGIPPTEPVD